MPHNNRSDDPMDSAFNASLAPRNYFGQVDIDTYYCVLEKGVGKVMFDANVHSLDQRRTSIEITVTPIPDMPRPDPLSRQMIAESREWVNIVLASLKELGVSSLRDLKGKWAKVTFVPTGRKWTTQDGEEREATTFKFLAVYDTEAAAAAAYAAEGNGTASEAEDEHPEDTSSGDKATAYEFLRVLVNQHKADPAMLATTIASIPAVSKWFTIDSPETQELLKKAS